MAVRIQLRRDTASNWSTNNPYLKPGEIGIEIDTLKMKVGPATNVASGTQWNSISAYSNVVPTDLNTTLNGYLQVSDLSKTSGTGVAELIDGDLYIPKSSIIFEGATENSYELTLVAPDVTADKTINLPNANTTLVGTDTTDTLTNKTLTSPVVSGLSLSDASIVFEGAVADSYETTLTVGEPTADRTITLPDVTGTVVTTGDTASVTNAMLAGSIANNKLANSSVTINGYEIALGTSASYGTDNINEGTTNKYFTDERAQDAVAAALAAGTHTNITVSYDDTANSISLTGAQTYNDEMARDAIGAALTGGTGITVTPNDNADTITVAVDSTIATKTYADNAVTTGISSLVASAPSTLDTLNELAVALGNDANFATTVTNALAAKAPLASPTFTGTVTLPTGTVTSDMILDGTIVNADINASAAIDKTKISGTAITAADTGTVTSTMIADGTILNADINASAAIALSKLATDPLARANHTGTQTASTISDFDTQVRTSKVTDLAAPTDSFSMNSQKITNLATPTSSNDAANKSYVDNIAAGLNFHAAVHAATTANLTGTYSNGTSGVGATLTSSSNGALVVDGHTMLADERILVKNQTTGSQNGIYVVTATGDGSNPWILTRATDADNSPSGEVSYGDFCFVQDGTSNGGYGYILNTTGTVTIGTTSLSYTQFNAGQSVVAGNGLTESSPGTISINTSVTADLSTAQTLTNKTITGTFTGNLTGNADTVTNGVYTSGSYSNPSWITGLAWSKISSTPTTISGYGIANAVVTDAANTITAATSSTKPLILKGATSQTANLQEWQNSSGTLLARIQSDGAFVSDYITTGLYLTSLGKLRAGSASNYGAQFEITPTATTNIGVVIRAAASQTANLQEWQNSSGTVLASVNASGDLSVQNLTVNGTTTTISSTTLTVSDKNIEIAKVSSPTNITADGAGITVKGSTDKTFNWVAATTAFTSSEDLDLATGKVLKIAGTQVLSATQYTGNAATVTNGVYTSGSYSNPSWITGLAWSKISSTPTTISGYGITNAVVTDGANTITAASASTNPLAIKAATSQSANLQEWQYSNGTVAASVSASGVFNISTNNLLNYGYSTFAGNGASFIQMKVMAAPSQTASIQEWQNSSGTMLAKVDASGNITGASIIKTGGTSSQFLKADGSVDSTSYLSGTVGATSGGTGLTSYTTGDILYASATNTLAKLAAGTNGQVLTLSAGVPTWAAAAVTYSAPTIGSTSIASGATVTLISGLTLKDTSSTTVSANTATTVDTNALSGFTTAKYVVSIKQGSKVRSSEVIVQTDGTSVDLTEFGITETGGTMSGVVVSATTVSTNAVLQVTITDAASTNATVKINKILI